VQLRQGGGTPLFCLPAGDGNVLVYRLFADHMSGDNPVYALPAVGVDGLTEPLRTIEDMADQIADVLLDATDAPFQLVGYSLGGVLAVETARRLEALGREVSFVGLIDTSYPVAPAIFSKSGRVVRALARRDRLAFAGTVRSLWRDIRVELGRIRHGSKWIRYVRRGERIPAELAGKRITHANMRAMRRHVPRPYAGRVVYFEAVSGTRRRPAHRPWMASVAELEAVSVPGEHHGDDSVMSEPHVAVLAAEVSQRLADRSRSDASDA
jgi:thioesterase domain-containing protein